MQDYIPAAEVQEIAEPLITAHHEALRTAPIRYLFTLKPRKHQGRLTWGSLQLVGGLHAYLSTENTETYFVMLIDHERWIALSEEQRQALVDHELCHGTMTPAGHWALRTHDLEEFAEVLARHGLWRKDIEGFMRQAKQMLLFQQESPSAAAVCTAP